MDRRYGHPRTAARTLLDQVRQALEAYPDRTKLRAVEPSELRSERIREGDDDVEELWRNVVALRGLTGVLLLGRLEDCSELQSQLADVERLFDEVEARFDRL